jgi:3-phosphoshikimate 1-carboxyvinyltransferase
MSATPSYPDKLEIIPLTRPPKATVRVPGSKSITNRALVLAALERHPTGHVLNGALHSEDTALMIQCLQSLGFDLRADWDATPPTVTFSPSDGPVIPVTSANLFVGNSGTTMRFLTALVCLGHGRYRLDGIPRMRERPIEDLLATLRQLGAHAYSEAENGCPPVVVEAKGLKGGKVPIRGDVSSQFLSGLLMAASAAESELIIEVEGAIVSRPYIRMTQQMMERFGVRVEASLGRVFRVSPGFQTWEPSLRNRLLQYDVPSVYNIEPDASAASYFLAAAAITSGEIVVPLSKGESLQGDVRFVDRLEMMGCQVRRGPDGVTVVGRPLHRLDTDMNDISDTVMTLAAVACFAEGPTTIRNVAHIRHKETDRLAALAAELRRVGAGVDEFADGLTITPRPLHGAEIETYNDHRMAMSMALIGLKVPGVVIKNPGCVAKTYPDFFADLEKLR